MSKHHSDASAENDRPEVASTSSTIASSSSSPATTSAHKAPSNEPASNSSHLQPNTSAPSATASARRSSARSEASAKMRAALSASSSPVQQSNAQFASPAATSSAPLATSLSHPSHSIQTLSSASSTLGVPVPPSAVSPSSISSAAAPRSPTLPAHFAAAAAPSSPVGPYSPTFLSQPGPSNPSTSLPASALNQMSAPPQPHVAPAMAVAGRSPSLPGPANMPNGVALAQPLNGRVRAQTAAFAGPNGSTMMPPPSSYAPSTRSLRSSPQMPAQINIPVPALHGMTSPAFPTPQTPHSHPMPMSGPAYERHTAELTNCIVAFLSPILPTEEEYRIKEATRRQLERLANRISPGAKLLAFGSMANGFALRNSDMDLCCLIGKKDGQPTTQHTASELVEILGQLIREETDFNVMPLPKARIPIIKISRAPTPDLPYEISCDIGFENRLALENTRLLLSYAMVDPPRLRTLVLFLKVWTKRRKLNSPYTGTLSSYGYTLLALFFLTHVKKPAVLPNLQAIPPNRPLAPHEIELNGNNIYFYDDVATLRKEWASQNTENVGELLIDFFRYFSKEFSYSKDVVSLRTEGGIISKDNKNWNAELCIEDPFQMGYNVSRTVTKDGLYTIRGEFMRASRILLSPKSTRVSALIAELCEERDDSLTRAPDSHSPRTKAYGARSAGLDSRGYRDVYANSRRYDTPPSYSGFGGSFAFEQMARGLGQGVAYPPTTAMLAPLSRNHGLSPKAQPSRFTAQQEGGLISSALSESGTASSFDYPRGSIGHASARTSPSFKHAVPNGIGPGGPGAQEAFAYGAEISFGPQQPVTTRDDMANPRTKTSRSLSESLNRSMSLPRHPPNDVDEQLAALTLHPRPSDAYTAWAGGVEDDAVSLVSEATADDLPTPQEPSPPRNLSPRSSVRLPDSIIVQAKNRRQAQAAAAAARANQA